MGSSTSHIHTRCPEPIGLTKEPRSQRDNGSLEYPDRHQNCKRTVSRKATATPRSELPIAPFRQTESRPRSMMHKRWQPRDGLCEIESFERDNARVNRDAGERYVVSGADDKIGVSQSSAKRCSHSGKRGFGSTLCYPACRVRAYILSRKSTRGQV